MLQAYMQLCEEQEVLQKELESPSDTQYRGGWRECSVQAVVSTTPSRLPTTAAAAPRRKHSDMVITGDEKHTSSSTAARGCQAFQSIMRGSTALTCKLCEDQKPFQQDQQVSVVSTSATSLLWAVPSTEFATSSSSNSQVFMGTLPANHSSGSRHTFHSSQYCAR